MDKDKFKNRLDAAKWLESEGYPVKRSKFYQDCNAGKVPINPDKTISCFEVAKYGILQLKTKVGAYSLDNTDAAEAEVKKKVAEAEIATLKAARLAREEDAFWLPADDAWAAIAGLVIQIKAAVRHSLYAGRREIVQVAAGNQERADEVFGYIDKLIDDALNEVAGQGISIEFGK
jgi:hypothetical protein